MKKISLFLVFLAFASCSYFKKDAVDTSVVVRVGENVLYKNDILKILPQNYSLEDSLQITTTFVNNWALKHILMDKAQEYISDESKAKFEELVQEYRTDLYTQSYLEMLVAKEIDTLVTENDFLEFYQKNKNIFRLNEDLVKIRYVHLSENSVNSKKITEAFKRFNKKDKKNLETLSVHAISSYFNDSIWLKADEVYQRLPFLKTRLSEGVSSNSFLEKRDSTGIYMVKLAGILKKNGEPPMEYIRPMLKQVILNQRKQSVVKKLEKEIIHTAIKKKQFEIYE